jgi:hypothetical protein
MQFKPFVVAIEMSSQWGGPGRYVYKPNASVAITPWHVRVLNQDGKNLIKRRTCS